MITRLDVVIWLQVSGLQFVRFEPQEETKHAVFLDSDNRERHVPIGTVMRLQDEMNAAIKDVQNKMWRK